MKDMGLLEWALMFDKITWVDYLLFYLGLIAVAFIGLGVMYWRDKH